MSALTAPPPGASKPEWRAWAAAKRAGLDYADLSRSVVTALTRWPPIITAGRVLLFFPLGDEIDLTGLFDAGLAASFAATRTPQQGGTLTVHELGGELEVHRLGFRQPAADAPRLEPSELDVLLLPGLAFDLWGTRLGRGAGYFDRLLMEVDASIPVVGVTPASLVVDRLPREAHDLPVGHLATEEGIVAVAPAGSWPPPGR